MADNEFPSASATGPSIANYIVSSGSTGNATSNTYFGDATSTVSSFQWSTPMTYANLQSAVNRLEGGETRISARLCFKFIKSKLNLIEVQKNNARLRRLEKMVDEYVDIGQIAMAEQCLKMFMEFTKESAIWACGYKYWITKEIAEKYKYQLKDGRTLKVTPLENFGRTIPKNVVLKLKACNAKKIFDSYVIFHLDAKDRSSHIETQKQKEEREKDPILFGQIKECPEKYYFIADWEDELDDLRFSDILEALSLEKNDNKIENSVSMEDVRRAINGNKELKNKLT